VTRARRWTCGLLLLALASCARSNASILADLERDASGAALADRPLPVASGSGATLPMEEGRLPVVLGAANGVRLPLIVDTGTSHLWLSGPAARGARMRLSDGEAREVTSPGYAERAHVGVVDRLDLGALRFGRGAALVSLREQPSFWYHNLPGPEYGILGTSVLGHFRVTFDFARREIRLRAHGRETPGRPLLAPVTVGGRQRWFLVDSGAAHLFLEPWLARELGLISTRRAARHGTKAERAEDQVITMVRVSEVTIAGRRFEDVRAGVVHTFDGEREIGGLLGFAGFGKLVWTVDFGTRELLVEDA